MVGPITGPSDSYNPLNPTLSSIDTDLAAAQSAYDTAQSTVTTTYNDYTTSKNNLIAVVNNPSSTQTDINNAYQDFDTKRMAYYAALENFKTAASHLIDVKGYRLQYLDDTTTGLINSLMSEFTSLLNTVIISNSIYNSLTTGLNDLAQAQTNIGTALNSLMDNEPLIAEARIQYIELDDEGFIAQLQGDTATYNQRQTDKANTQTEIDSLVATRDSLYSSLTTYMNDYSAAYDNIQTLLHQVGVDLPTTVNDFNAQLQQATHDALNLMTSLQQQISATDQLTESAYLVTHPTTDGTVEGAITAAQQASKVLIDKILGSGLNTFTPTQIDLPVLPTAGALSINDLMRFITKVQIYIQQLLSNIQLADSRLRELRLKLINAESDPATSEAALRSNQLDSLTASDKQYDQQVIMDNLGRYYAAVQAVDYYNSVVGQINTKIDDFNAQVDQFNLNSVDVVDQINTIAPEITTTTGYATTVPPASVNDLDILNVEPTYSDLGSTVANPGTVSYPGQEEHLSNTQPINVTVPPYDTTVGNIPSFNNYQSMLASNIPPILFSTATPPSQNQLDAFNAVLTSINSTLAPIIDRLGPPINFTPFEPLVYRDSITIRTAASSFNIVSFLGSFSSLQSLLFRLIFGAILRNSLETKNFLTNLPSVFGPLSAPETAKTRTEGIGSGVGITGANYLAPPSKVQNIIINALSKEDFRTSTNRFLELAGLTAGLQASIRLPSEFRNYSVMGQVRSDRVQQTQTAKDQAANTVASDEAAKNLLSFSGDTGLLTTAAQELLAAISDSADASAAEIKQLLALLVFLQQLVLVLIAAATGLVGAGAATPAELANGIRNLFGTGAQAGSVLGTNNASIAVANTLSSGGLSTQSTNAVVGLLSGTGNNVSNINTLNQNGFNLPITDPQNPDFIKKLLNQTDEQLDQQHRDALADELAQSLRQLGIRQEDIDKFTQQVKSGQKLGDAYTTTLANAPSTLVQGLGTNSQNVSPEQSAKISAGASALGNNFSSLSPTDKTTFLTAINTGALSPQQSGNAVGALLHIDNQGATPENVRNFSQAVSGTAPATPSTPIPSISPELQNAFNGTFAKLFNDPATERYVRQLAENFANTIEKQTSFSKFSVDFILDPAKSMLKNFSIATQEGTGPSAQTPNIIPV